MSAPFTDSQDTTLTYEDKDGAPVTYYCTSIVRNAEGGGDLTDQKIDVSTLDLVSGACRVYQNPPLQDCGAGGASGTRSFQIDFYGPDDIDLNDSRNLIIKQVQKVGEAAVTIFDGDATCTSCSTTWATGEVVSGSATFSVDE